MTTLHRRLLITGILCTVIPGYITIAGLTGFCPMCTLVVDSVRGRTPPTSANSSAPAAPSPLLTAQVFPLAENAQPQTLASAIAAIRTPGKPVILDIWSIACAPCIQQRAVFAELADHFTILSLSVDRNPQQVSAWLAAHPSPTKTTELIAPPETIALIAADAGGAINLPRLLLLDDSNRVLKTFEGFQDAKALTSSEPRSGPGQ